MVSVSADMFLGRLLSVLASEVSLLGGVGDEIDNLKRELSAIGAFLVDAEKKNGLTESEKTWVEQVKKIAYDVEIIVDEYTYHVTSQQVGGQFTRFVRGTFYLPKNLLVRRKIVTKLQKISNTLRAIPETNRRYGLKRVEGRSSSHNDENWLRNIGESSLFINEDHLVGIEHQKQLLIEWLVDGESSLTHFSLVGMGGSGKTTLAAKTYTNDNVKRHFGCCAWITISQTYVIDDLLKRLIKEIYGSTKEEIPSDLNTMAHRDLLFELVNYLKTRRYLVVLDDVWEAKLLMEMALVFQNTQMGSRIIVTTRNEDVASFSFGVPSHSHLIQPLSKEECWALFSMKAFSHCQVKSCPPEVEPIARELVGRCKGLPLAIVALGGLMASKTTVEEWKRVSDSLCWELFNNPMLESMTKRILLLSFNDLPYRLKHCFLYCSIFPEDHIINCIRLTDLWLAEGFVEEVNRVRPRKVAESYLLELVSRSMLQDCSVVRTGIPKECKMHDLMRELALSISERENFCVFYDGKQTLEDHKARRLSVQIRDSKLKYYKGMPQLCSLLVFVKDLDSLSSLSDVLPIGLKLLRVLDLLGLPIVKVPTELPYLFNLRYLNLRGTSIKELPNSIGGLQNLETLDIGDTKIEKLPSGVAKCKKLTCLSMYNRVQAYSSFKYLNGTRAPLGICNLKKLEILISIEAEGGIIKQLGNMTQLTQLGITSVREEDGMDLCVSIQNLKLLQFLLLTVAEEEKLLKIEALPSPPPVLETLFLCGKLERVPLWFPLLGCLRRLYLRWSRLTDDPLPHICALPCLEELRLVNAFSTRRLHFSNGFLKLRDLALATSSVTEIVFQRGVMPDLKLLTFSNVMEMKTIPRGIEYLTKLRSLELDQVSEELVDRIRGEGAVDHQRVKHIPEIDYYFFKTNCKRRNHESLS